MARTSAVQAETPRRILVLSIPRSASHLLCRRILSKQPKFAYQGYSFNEYIYMHHALLDKGVTLDQLPSSERDKLLVAAQKGLQAMKQSVIDFEAQGKIPLIKDHLGSLLDPFLTGQSQPGQADFVPWKSVLSEGAMNPTLLPDSYIQTFQPLFLIRHPALAYPSLLRKSIAIMPHITIDSKGITIELTMRWSRMTYDWFKQQHDTSDSVASPIVVDADDIMHDRAVMRKLATLLGGDPDQLIWEWAAATKEEVESTNPFSREFESTLLASSSIVTGKDSKGVTIDGEMVKWVAEFGQETAEKLKGHVERALPDYEYLKSRKLS